ncbi:MAG: aldo/keto reductase [Promethearchaeota archaeon]|nr:MAG: aldo/keto reductase [Candidatus Lokiarchaeota archaeon]
MTLKIDTQIELNNGVQIPIIGLGTWVLNGKEAYNAVSWALEMDYRLIDTATIYGNERKVGEAIKDSGIPRDEVFITTKVWKSDQGYDNTLRALEKSLKKLGIDYVDLYLIHWPVPGKTLDTWKAMEKIYEDGKARAIGVSNYNLHFLNQLLDNSEEVPAVNQIEFSPFLYQKELLEFCELKNIKVEAYSPLTRGKKLDNPKVLEIAQKYDKSAAQVLIRWGLQHQIIEIPKSGNKEHLKENINVFDFNLNTNDMQELDNLNKDLRVVEDPVLHIE